MYSQTECNTLAILATCTSLRAASQALRRLRPAGALVLLGSSGERFTLSTKFVMSTQRIVGAFRCLPEDLFEVFCLAASGKVKAVAGRFRGDWPRCGAA
jgi:D-arabinose 1-dehydrogenase-like Zn-dependent alcohol dehydrogenase